MNVNFLFCMVYIKVINRRRVVYKVKSASTLFMYAVMRKVAYTYTIIFLQLKLFGAECIRKEELLANGNFFDLFYKSRSHNKRKGPSI